MSFPAPPMKAEAWTIEILNELIKHPDVENETLDFKERRMGELAKDIAAMANTSGGILALGIEQTDDGFSKDGWDKGDEDKSKKQISDHLYKIQPVPKINPVPLYDTNGKFYWIVAVEPVIKHRPYMINGQCFIRVGSNTMGASREIVLNLCKLTIDRKVSVEMLGSVTTLIRKSIDKFDEINRSRDIPLGMPLVDVDWFANAGFNCNWLLAENDLLLESKERTGPLYAEGFYTTIRQLRQLNNSIELYNKKAYMDQQRIQAFEIIYGQWSGFKFQELRKYLDKVSKAVDDFLKESA